MGNTHFGNHRGGYGADYRCGTDGYLHPAVCYAEAAEAHHHLRKRCSQSGVCQKALSDVLLCEPEECEAFVKENSDHGGADVVLEVAGGRDTFQLAWKCARPNAIVTVVALYDEAQSLPLPDMYGKNLIFKTGGVDGCDCAEILHLIEEGKIDTTPLITHRFKLADIEEAYRIFENRLDGVIKIAITE